eukprot:4167712-Alexandrium_andersonii.AAC.1
MAIEAMPMPAAAPCAMPANSASPELGAIVFSVVGQRLMARAPTTRGSPSAETPGKVGVHERADCNPL